MIFDKITVLYLRNFLRPILTKLIIEQLDAINKCEQRAVECNVIANAVAEALVAKYKITGRKKNG